MFAAGPAIDTRSITGDIQVLTNLLALLTGVILVTRLPVMGRYGRLSWKNTRKVVLTSFSAVLYTAVVVTFEVFVLIPGISGSRPAVRARGPGGHTAAAAPGNQAFR